MQTFNIDISQPRGPLVLYASQGDSLSRLFSVTVTDNGAAYEPPEGAIYTVRFGTPGMPAGWYDTITEVGGGTHPAVVVSGNAYTVELAEQAVSTPGTNAVVLIVSDATGYTLASWAFELNVAAVAGYDAPEATVYYNALTEQVAQVLASATNASSSATLAESWAVGGTGTREGENTNNAQYWAQQAQTVAQGAIGWYETEQALQAAHPTGENGQWAIIGSTDTIWTWDSDTSAWVNSGSTADLSNYYTKAQADAAFATAAQGALAASAVQSVNGKTGTAVTLNPQDVGGISTYTCVTSGTTHALTGAGGNIKFVADAAYNESDTITVNGTAVTAQTQDGAALSAGAWAAGAVVMCYLDGETLNFRSGGVGQNYRVMVSPTLPDTASENTVWVGSDVPLSRYCFSAGKPTSINGSPVQNGDVWIQTALASPCAFNAAETNALFVYPIGAYQYNSTSAEWVSKTMAVYLSGQWVYPYQDVTLYDNGYVNAELIGGFNLYPLSGGFGTPTVWEQQSTSLAIYTDANTGAKAGSFVTQKTVDLTGYKNIEVSVTNVYTSSPMCRLAVFSDVSNPLVIDNAAAQIDMTQNGTFELDVSSLQGDYFVVYYCGNTSSDQAAAGANVTSIKMTV